MITTYEASSHPTLLWTTHPNSKNFGTVQLVRLAGYHCRRVAVRLLPDYDLAGYHPEQSLEGIGGEPISVRRRCWKAREKLMLAITHDFKAPLGVYHRIYGFIDRVDYTDERQRFYLDNMKKFLATSA